MYISKNDTSSNSKIDSRNFIWNWYRNHIFCYPVVKHLISEKYRIKFKIEEFGKELFTYETLKYLKIGLVYGFLYGFIVGTVIGPFGAVNGL